MKKIIYWISILILTMISSLVYATDIPNFTPQWNIYVTTWYVWDTFSNEDLDFVRSKMFTQTTWESPWSIAENSWGGWYSYLDDISEWSIGWVLPIWLSLNAQLWYITGDVTTPWIWYFSVMDTNGFGTQIFQITVLSVLEPPVENNLAQSLVDMSWSWVIQSSIDTGNWDIGDIVLVLVWIGMMLFLGWTAFLHLRKSRK